MINPYFYFSAFWMIMNIAFIPLSHFWGKTCSVDQGFVVGVYAVSEEVCRDMSALWGSVDPQTNWNMRTATEQECLCVRVSETSLSAIGNAVLLMSVDNLHCWLRLSSLGGLFRKPPNLIPSFSGVWGAWMSCVLSAYFRLSVVFSSFICIPDLLHHSPRLCRGQTCPYTVSPCPPEIHLPL